MGERARRVRVEDLGERGFRAATRAREGRRLGATRGRGGEGDARAMDRWSRGTRAARSGRRRARAIRGTQGVNIMMFCKEYNARTQDQPGMIIPVEITVFEDKSFTFILKTPPASVLLKKAAGVPKGAGDPQKQVVGRVTKEQLEEIAKIKMPDLNCVKVESAMKVVAGTAANMGIKIDGWPEVDAA